MMITSAEEFVNLRTSEDMALYTRAALDPAPDDVWLDVIAKYPEMKVWVARNKTVPLSILEILADDSNPQVRCAVAEKRKLTAELFAVLAKDRDETVRQRIACNAKTPSGILKYLANDESDIVASVAQERLDAASE